MGPLIRNEAVRCTEPARRGAASFDEPETPGRKDVIDGVTCLPDVPTATAAVTAINGNASSHLPMELLECRTLRVGYAVNMGEPK